MSPLPNDLSLIHQSHSSRSNHNSRVLGYLPSPSDHSNPIQTHTHTQQWAKSSLSSSLLQQSLKPASPPAKAAVTGASGLPPPVFHRQPLITQPSIPLSIPLSPSQPPSTRPRPCPRPSIRPCRQLSRKFAFPTDSLLNFPRPFDKS